jgi:hypothetical protein
METWYKVSLSEQDISEGRGIALQEQFTALFIATGAPKDAAMFDNTSISPPYICFFTPGAFRLAELLLRGYGVTECKQPNGTSGCTTGWTLRRHGDFLPFDLMSMPQFRLAIDNNGVVAESFDLPIGVDGVLMVTDDHPE